MQPAAQCARALLGRGGHLLGRAVDPQPQVRAVQPVPFHLDGQPLRRVPLGERQDRLAQQRALDRLVVVGDQVAGALVGHG